MKTKQFASITACAFVVLALVALVWHLILEATVAERLVDSLNSDRQKQFEPWAAYVARQRPDTTSVELVQYDDGDTYLKWVSYDVEKGVARVNLPLAERGVILKWSQDCSGYRCDDRSLRLRDDELAKRLPMIEGFFELPAEADMKSRLKEMTWHIRFVPNVHFSWDKQRVAPVRLLGLELRDSRGKVLWAKAFDEAT